MSSKKKEMKKVCKFKWEIFNIKSKEELVEAEKKFEREVIITFNGNEIRW